MAMNIERLLRMTLDYHNFCSDEYAQSAVDIDELTAEELDFVAAAAGVPIDERNPEKDKYGL